MDDSDSGILIEARNGPVIAYDTTGLRLRLSDSVIADIAARLAPAGTDVPASVLGDIDAWGVSRRGDTYVFDAKLPSYPFPRRFRRHVEGTGIFADPPGALTGLFGLGGHRAAVHRAVPLAHPAHVVTADDDIGAVGMGGQGAAPVTDRLHPVRAATTLAATADALVGLRADAGRALPLVVVRTETDGSGGTGDFARGPAMENVARAVANLAAAARALGVAPRLPAVCLDMAGDDVTGDDDAHLHGIYRVMEAVTDIAVQHRLPPPAFLMEACDLGVRVAAHHRLSLCPAGHRLVMTAPGRVAERVRGRVTAAGLARLAALRAHALDAVLGGRGWAPPRLLLAERRAGGLRVTCDGGPLTLGPGDSGFTLGVDGAPLAMGAIRIAPDDPRAVEIDVPDLPDRATLGYGTTALGALHDDWSAPGPDGADLRRHALPAILEVR